MDTNNKLKFQHFILIYSVAFVVASVFSIVVSSVVNNSSNLYVFLLFLLPQICYLSSSAIFIWGKQLDFTLLKKENIKPKSYVYAIIIGLGMFFVAILPNYYFQLLLNKLSIKATVILPDFVSIGDYFFAVLLICLLPAVGEEIVFRKILCESLQDIDQTKIVLISGAIFSLTHFNLAQTFYQFFIGCILAYLYLKTKNITLTILIHFINNLLALFLTSITGDAVWHNIIVLIISCVVGLLMLIGGLLWLKKSEPLLKKTDKKINIYTLGFLFVIIILWLVAILSSL